MTRLLLIPAEKEIDVRVGELEVKGEYDAILEFEKFEDVFARVKKKVFLTLRPRHFRV